MICAIICGEVTEVVPFNSGTGAKVSIEAASNKKGEKASVKVSYFETADKFPRIGDYVYCIADGKTNAYNGKFYIDYVSHELSLLGKKVCEQQSEPLPVYVTQQNEIPF